MKYIAMAILAVLAFVLTAAMMDSGDNSFHKTEYQDCMDNARLLRSESDTKVMERLCDSLPVDPRDIR